MFDPKLISSMFRELADWIELRTGGEEPRDVARIELARTMAAKVEEFEAELARFKKTLDRMAAEGQGDLLDGGGFEIGNDGAPVTPFIVGKVVAQPPADPVERCGCKTLTFSKNASNGTLSVICDQGKTSVITLQKIYVVSTPHDVMLEISRQLAREHGLDTQEVFTSLEKHWAGFPDTETITVGIYSSPPSPPTP